LAFNFRIKFPLVPMGWCGSAANFSILYLFFFCSATVVPPCPRPLYDRSKIFRAPKAPKKNTVHSTST
jgi:hypothetical protein